MGKIKSYPPVKLIAAIASSDVNLWEDCQHKLEVIYSPIDYVMNWYNFFHTEYYLPEMGKNLKKKIISFRELILAHELPAIKLATNQLETEFAIRGKRRINIDPGYICAAKLVLATTKDYSHRLYLNNGIFGDLHLRYQKGGYQAQEWTYPDYRMPEVLTFFNEVREIYLKQLANAVF